MNILEIKRLSNISITAINALNAQSFIKSINEDDDKIIVGTMKGRKIIKTVFSFHEFLYDSRFYYLPGAIILYYNI